MSKPSRFPAMAGTVLGLLGAALGAWFLYPQHVGPPSDTINPPARQQAAGQPLNRTQAEARLMALPELQMWAKRIEETSGGKVRGAIVAFDPALRTLDGRRYHQLAFVENRPDAAAAWESFLVDAADGTILVDDAAGGAPLTLARWRSERHPQDRTGPAAGPAPHP